MPRFDEYGTFNRFGVYFKRNNSDRGTLQYMMSFAMMILVASNSSNSNNTTVMLSAQEQITMMMNDDLLVTEPPANRDDGTLPVFKISYIIGSGTILKVHIVC